MGCKYSQETNCHHQLVISMLEWSSPCHSRVIQGPSFGWINNMCYQNSRRLLFQKYQNWLEFYLFLIWCSIQMFLCDFEAYIVPSVRWKERDGKAYHTKWWKLFCWTDQEVHASCLWYILQGGVNSESDVLLYFIDLTLDKHPLKVKNILAIFWMLILQVLLLCSNFVLHHDYCNYILFPLSFRFIPPAPPAWIMLLLLVL